VYHDNGVVHYEGSFAPNVPSSDTSLLVVPWRPPWWLASGYCAFPRFDPRIRRGGLSRVGTLDRDVVASDRSVRGVPIEIIGREGSARQTFTPEELEGLECFTSGSS
jgi:hypothetical protein